MRNFLIRHLFKVGLDAVPAAYLGDGTRIVISACAVIGFEVLRLVTFALVILSGVFAAMLSGCDATPRECSGPPVYHRATLSVDLCPITFADIEATYRHRLEELGGCPLYLYRDEWCPSIDTADPAPESAAWFAYAFEQATWCHDLYWPRGAYCHGLAEGRYP